MSRSPGFELVQDPYVINTWFKFEDKIPNDQKVILFTRNHTDDKADDDADNDRTKNNTSPPVRGGRHKYDQTKYSDNCPVHIILNPCIVTLFSYNGNNVTIML